MKYVLNEVLLTQNCGASLLNNDLLVFVVTIFSLLKPGGGGVLHYVIREYDSKPFGMTTSLDDGRKYFYTTIETAVQENQLRPLFRGPITPADLLPIRDGVPA